MTRSPQANFLSPEAEQVVAFASTPKSEKSDDPERVSVNPVGSGRLCTTTRRVSWPRCIQLRPALEEESDTSHIKDLIGRQSLGTSDDGTKSLWTSVGTNASDASQWLRGTPFKLENARS